MPKLTIEASKKYDMIIESGALEKLGELILSVEKPQKVCLVSDTWIRWRMPALMLMSSRWLPESRQNQ